MTKTNDRQSIVGWDIGGVNIKAAQITWHDGRPVDLHTAVRAFEIWREPGHLIEVLQDIAEELQVRPEQPMAVTMTAELSDAFRTKREGVLFVLDAIERAFPPNAIHPFSVEGNFADIREAKEEPLLFAASNWLASALFTAEHYPNGILMDVGSTTTDIIPIKDGKVVCRGRNDTERLVAGELVYTGVLRTNPNTLADRVPVRGRACRLAAENFTLMADVYLILGRITPDEYGCPTADGRAKDIPAARDRLARLVCSDGEIMSDEEIHLVASFLRERQLGQLSESVFQVLSSVEDGFTLPLVVVGSGGFLAVSVAERLGLRVIEPEREWGEKTLAVFPAYAAARLLAREIGDQISNGNLG